MLIAHSSSVATLEGSRFDHEGTRVPRDVRVRFGRLKVLNTTLVPSARPFTMKKSGFSSRIQGYCCRGPKANSGGAGSVGDGSLFTYRTISGFSWSSRVTPSRRIPVSTSSRITMGIPHQHRSETNQYQATGDSLCITLRAPSSPHTLLAYKNGRPSPTARAPRQSAFSTSVPRRIPPSMNTWKSSRSNRSGLRSRSSWRIVIGAGELSTGEWTFYDAR